MVDVRGTACCGMRELHGIGTYRNNIPTLIRDLGKIIYYIGVPGNRQPQDPRFRFAVFTQATHDGSYGFPQETYGEKLADFIEKNNFGSLAKSATQTNPNTGNLLTVWVWGLNHTGLKRWLLADLKKRQDIAAKRKATREANKRKGK